MHASAFSSEFYTVFICRKRSDVVFVQYTLELQLLEVAL